MPRMDGIALVRQIKADERYRSLPVVIVSYKDRAEDRLRGLDAGADSYLTKSSFHDQTFLQTIVDLIGEAGRMRIGIVNDLKLACEALKRVVLSDPAHQVAWTGRRRRRRHRSNPRRSPRPHPDGPGHAPARRRRGPPGAS